MSGQLCSGHLHSQEIAPGEGLLGLRVIMDMVVKREIPMSAHCLPQHSPNILLCYLPKTIACKKLQSYTEAPTDGRSKTLVLLLLIL